MYWVCENSPLYSRLILTENAAEARKKEVDADKYAKLAEAEGVANMLRESGVEPEVLISLLENGGGLSATSESKSKSQKKRSAKTE